MWRKSTPDTTELVLELERFMSLYGLDDMGLTPAQVITDLIEPAFHNRTPLTPLSKALWYELAHGGIHAQQVVAAVRRAYFRLGHTLEVIQDEQYLALHTGQALLIDRDWTQRDRRLFRLISAEIMRLGGVPGEAQTVQLVWKFVGPQPVSALASSPDDPMWSFWEALVVGQTPAMKVRMELASYIGRLIVFISNGTTISWK